MKSLRHGSSIKDGVRSFGGVTGGVLATVLLAGCTGFPTPGESEARQDLEMVGSQLRIGQHGLLVRLPSGRVAAHHDIGSGRCPGPTSHGASGEHRDERSEDSHSGAEAINPGAILRIGIDRDCSVLAVWRVGR